MEESIKPYDDTTLFCCSGMQQFKSKFVDLSYKNVTISNIQPCIRINDIEEIKDQTHFLYFNMIGLFSFRDWSVKKTIDFWMEFLKRLDIKVDYITIHPDKFNQWKEYYIDYNIEVREDKDCLWTDGNLGGYCTEFYVNNIEIGNIVNCNGDCIDVGFGLERLDLVLNNRVKTEEEVLKNTIYKIIGDGYEPSHKKQGYVLKMLLRRLVRLDGYIDHEFFRKEKERQDKIISKYERLKDKFKDKSKEWWYETHGIDLDLL